MKKERFGQPEKVSTFFDLHDMYLNNPRFSGWKAQPCATCGAKHPTEDCSIVEDPKWVEAVKAHLSQKGLICAGGFVAEGH